MKSLSFVFLFASVFTTIYEAISSQSFSYTGYLIFIATELYASGNDGKLWNMEVLKLW